MFAGKPRRHHPNGHEVCAVRMLEVANDETSFRVSGAAVGTLVSSGC